MYLIYLPNKFDFYAAALRNYTQRLIFKNATNKKLYENLRKIYIAEAILGNENEAPVNLSEYLTELLSAVKYLKKEKGIYFNYKISLQSNFLINIKLFTALILNLCKITESISVFEKQGKIIINTKTYIKKENNSLIKRLKGAVYYEVKTGTSLIVLSFTATDKSDFCINSAYDFLLDTFSPPNIFI